MTDQTPGGDAVEVSADAVAAPTEKFSTAVGWSFAMNFGRLLATLGTTFLLASLLGPEAFGTVALALIYITLLQLIMQQGLVPAVIQRNPLTERHLDSAFWLTIGAASLLTVVGWVLSGWWATVNNTPDAAPVMQALSVLVLIKGLVAVQEAWLRRQLQFRSLALRTTAASICGAAVGVTWAIIDRSPWALVAQQITTDIVGCAVLWKVSSWRPRMRFWLSEARQLAGFAGKASVSSVGVFLNNRVDAALVGVYFGATAVGLYRLAARLVEAVLEFTVQPLQHVALPEFARYQIDPQRARERYRKLVLTSTTLAAPAIACVFAAAEPFLAVLGDEWSAAATPLQLLCIVGIVRAITMLNGSALQAAGRPGLQAKMTWTAAGLSCVSFVIVGQALTGRSVDAQVIGIAASRAVLYSLVLLPLGQLWFVARIFGLPLTAMLKLVGPTVAVTAGCAAFGDLVARALSDWGVPALVRLVVVSATTLVLCLGLLRHFNPEARRTFSALADRARGRRVSPSLSTSIGLPATRPAPADRTET